jgi:hypothetical protein
LFFLACSTNSATVLTGKSLVVTTRNSGISTSRATGCTSLSKLMANFFGKTTGVMAFVETLPIISV